MVSQKWDPAARACNTRKAPGKGYLLLLWQIIIWRRCTDSFPVVWLVPVPKISCTGTSFPIIEHIPLSVSEQWADEGTSTAEQSVWPGRFDWWTHSHTVISDFQVSQMSPITSLSLVLLILTSSYFLRKESRHLMYFYYVINTCDNNSSIEMPLYVLLAYLYADFRCPLLLISVVRRGKKGERCLVALSPAESWPDKMHFCRWLFTGLVHTNTITHLIADELRWIFKTAILLPLWWTLFDIRWFVKQKLDARASNHLSSRVLTR